MLSLQIFHKRSCKMKKSGRNNDFEKYVQCFYSFLAEQKMKRSVERSTILRTVFDFDQHFSVEMLQKKLKKQKCSISTSTLYTTLGLLMEAGLIFKHNLPGRTPHYEKFYGSDAHTHIYIEGTKESVECYDSLIEKIKQDIAEKYAIEITNYAFVLYGKKSS